MNRLFDKLAIMLICMVGFSMSENNAAPVAALLISVGASSLVQLFTGRTAAAVIIGVSAAMCGVLPVSFCALPLMLYDALWEKKWWLTLPAAAVLFRGEELSSRQIILTAAGCLITIIIYMRVSRLEETVERLTELRDEVTEKNLRLASQNVSLAQAQYNEIHLATLKERNRIAREIHDNVGHMLTRSLLQSGALMIINKDDNLKEPLASLRDTLDNAMTSIRQSVHDLHDDSIDLKAVIEDSMSSVDKRFDVRLDYDMGENIPGNIKLCMIGIVKESLSNAVKHSSGDRISIMIREHPAFYQLAIDDNGSCGEIKETGIGLKNMEDRAASVGGRISFTPSKNGFKIFMSIPK